MRGLDKFTARSYQGLRQRLLFSKQKAISTPHSFVNYTKVHSLAILIRGQIYAMMLEAPAKTSKQSFSGWSMLAKKKGEIHQRSLSITGMYTARPTPTPPPPPTHTHAAQ